MASQLDNAVSGQGGGIMDAAKGMLGGTKQSG
jgi:hypothetical protein